LDLLYNKAMNYLWDYDKKELEKTKKGRVFILERMINYGPGNEKIKLTEVRKNWKKLHLLTPQKRLLELLIWGEYQSSPGNKKSFWMK